MNKFHFSLGLFALVVCLHISHAFSLTFSLANKMKIYVALLNFSLSLSSVLYSSLGVWKFYDIIMWDLIWFSYVIILILFFYWIFFSSCFSLLIRVYAMYTRPAEISIHQLFKRFRIFSKRFFSGTSWISSQRRVWIMDERRRVDGMCVIPFALNLRKHLRNLGTWKFSGDPMS